MGREYYRNEQITICGEACLLETWHETRSWYQSNMRHSRVTHYASNAIFEATSDESYHISDPEAKEQARKWISPWVQKKREEERRRQEEERRRIEAMRRAEQQAYQRRLQQQRQEYERRQREQEAEQQRQREEHERQLRASQIVSMTALKNEKLAEKQRIITYELSPIDVNISRLNDQILTEEKELYKFSVERSDASCKTLVLLGMTGGGKSTFGNRLCGDVSIMANDSGPYKTSVNSKSCTCILQKFVYNKLSVVDCPGWSDTDTRDRNHVNNLCAYLRGCGGINAFVVIRNGSNPRFDAYFQQQLKYLESVFGSEFWNYLIVVLTHIDSGIAEIQFKGANKAQQMKEDISRLCNGVNDDVTVIPIGLDNYEDKIPQFMDAIARTRFICDNIESPIDDLKSNKNELMNQRHDIQERIDSFTQEINHIEEQIAALR